MLVLSRHESERIRINNDIVITVVRVAGDKVRLGIEAPRNVVIDREEVFQSKERERLNPRAPDRAA